LNAKQRNNTLPGRIHKTLHSKYSRPKIKLSWLSMTIVQSTS
jgi:hypothetical protein